MASLSELLKRNRLFFPILSMCCLILIYSFGEIPTLDSAVKKYDEIIVLNFIWSISIVYLLCFFMKTVKFNPAVQKIFDCFSIASVMIYAMHPYANNVANVIVSLFNIDFLRWFFIFFVSLLIMLPMVIIRNRYSNARLFKYV